MCESSLFLTRILDVLCDGGDKTAFVHGDGSMTYRETFVALRRLHGILRSECVRPDQLVAITGGNTPETILLQFAAHMRGAKVAYAETTAALDELGPDHLISPGPHGPVVISASGTAAVDSGCENEDFALPESVETLFLCDEGLVSYRDEYEELARTCAGHPDGPRRVPLIAPFPHPVGNRIACKALLSGDTLVLHEPEAGPDEDAHPREPGARVGRVPCTGRRGPVPQPLSDPT